MPTATDLVTDLPADFEVFGQAVDTRLKALQPGTTLGDLAYSSATANTNTRLPIGTSGQILSVSGGVPAWTTPSAGGASWTLLNAGGTALTGAQTITVSGISAKNDLFIIFSGASSATAQSEFRIRFNTDTGNNYAAFGIGNNYLATYSNQLLDYESDSARSSIRMAQMTTTATNVCSGYLYVSGANTSGIKAVHGAGAAQQGTGAKQYAIGGYWSGSATVSSVSINSEFGNFDAGTIFVYTSA
jgi:hypothetical protein